MRQGGRKVGGLPLSKASFDYREGVRFGLHFPSPSWVFGHSLAEKIDQGLRIVLVTGGTAGSGDPGAVSNRGRRQGLLLACFCDPKAIREIWAYSILNLRQLNLCV